MPGLLRGVARTAVVAGTATAVSGRGQRRQAEKYSARDAQIYADRQQAYEQQYEQQHPQQQQYAQPQYAQPQYAQPAAPPPDPIEQLKALAEMKAQGVLTEEEFAAQKATIRGT